MSRPPYRWIAAALDSLGLVAVLACSGLWPDFGTTWTVTTDRGVVLALFVLLWLATASHIGVYRAAPSHNLLLACRRTLEAWAATWGVAGLLTITTVAPPSFSIWFVLAWGSVHLVAVRFLMAFAPWLQGSDRIRAVVIGTCPAGAFSPQNDTESHLQLVGVVPFSHEGAAADRNLPTLGEIADLPRILDSHQVDAAIVTPSDAAITGEVRAAFRTCSDRGVTVHFFPSLLDANQEDVRITWQADRDGLDIVNVTSTRRALALGVKRAIDIAGAGLGILALLPVFVGCAAAVKLTSQGPVFFRQTRVGAGGRHFPCLKFRTMRVGAHAQQELLRSNSVQDGPAFKMPSDPRITPVGRILRKFSLDELPQMFNVLLGDMSLVGPRPPIPSEVDRYTWWQRRRISIKPGLTCLWQVYGRNRVSFKRWVEMDLFYIDNWSLWMDLKLIAHTVRVVLRGTGM